MIVDKYPRVKGVIFDMDGTMIDNMMVHHQAWQRKLHKLGLDLTIDQVKEKVHGINEEILERLFGDQYTPEERVQLAYEKEEDYRKIFKDSLRLIDGLDEYLMLLRKKEYRLAIGSAAPPENINFVLDNLDIRDLFEVVLHSRDVKKGKPDPEIYLSIMQKMHLKPEECIIFEDSPVGAEAAVMSGAKTVVITTTHSVEDFKHLGQIELFIKTYRF